MTHTRTREGLSAFLHPLIPGFSPSKDSRHDHARSMDPCNQAEPPPPVPAAALAAADGDGGHDHAGVLVLTNRTLFELITGFMSGYPRLVYDVVSGLNPEQVMNRSLQGVSYRWTPASTTACCRTSRSQRTTQRCSDCSTTCPSSRATDETRSSGSRRSCASQWFTNKSTCSTASRRWGESSNTQEWRISYLMRMALYRHDPDLNVIEWVYTHIPRDLDLISGNDLHFHVERGDLNVVQWLYEYGCKITQRLVNAAAISGHAHVLRYLYEKSGKRCASTAVHKVVKNGDMDTLSLIFEKQKVDIRRIALSSAAELGRLEIATLLGESIPGVVTEWMLGMAARYGHLDVLKYLLENFVGERTVQLMTAAAEYGHLEIVRFLHENRTEGCSPVALERAARNGYLDVVEFLHDTYGFECSREAMATPASRRRWEFLQRNGILED